MPLNMLLFLQIKQFWILFDFLTPYRLKSKNGFIWQQNLWSPLSLQCLIIDEFFKFVCRPIVHHWFGACWWWWVRVLSSGFPGITAQPMSRKLGVWKANWVIWEWTFFQKKFFQLNFAFAYCVSQTNYSPVPPSTQLYRQRMHGCFMECHFESNAFGQSIKFRFCWANAYFCKPYLTFRIF